MTDVTYNGCSCKTFKPWPSRFFLLHDTGATTLISKTRRQFSGALSDGGSPPGLSWEHGVVEAPETVAASGVELLVHPPYGASKGFDKHNTTPSVFR